jgi:hypothetical protein
LSKL